MASSNVQSFLRKIAVIAPAALLLMICPLAQSQTPTPDGFFRTLVRQRLILLNVGDQQKVRLKKDHLRSVHGSCDIAVMVDAAEWDGRTARFVLQNIGSPSAAGQQRRYCKMSHTGTLLEISGFAADERPDSLKASLSQVLLTPEQYMASQGVSFGLPLGPEDEVVAKIPPQIQPARALFTVDPAYSEEARRMKYQGTLRLSVVVGTDGRPHRIRAIRPLGRGLDEMALTAMPMWRFEPARQNDKPVAAETMIEVSFNLY